MPTVSYGIAATADDTTIINGAGADSTLVLAGDASALLGVGPNYVGLRFVAVTVPQGATIDSATLTLKRQDAAPALGVAAGGSAWGTIKGADVDNCAAWTTTDPQAVAKTTAATTITNSATVAYDVAAIVQEITDRAGWSSGNALGFATDPTGANGFIEWTDRNASSTDCAQLLITYTAGGPDVTPPTITSANTVSVAENATLAHALTANETVTWSIVGGADQAQFEISSSTLRWSSNGTRDFESPADADANNAYVVTVRATDTASNTTDQTITVTVTDIDWTFVAVSGPTTVASGNITLTEPSGAASGDLLVAAISVRSNVAFTLPSGWSLIQQQTSGNTTANGTGSIGGGLLAYIVRGASAPSYAFTRTGGDVAIGRVLAYRFDGPGTITLDASSSNTLATASTTVTTPGITTTADRALCIAALFGARNVTASAFDAATDPTTASGATNTTVRPQDGTWTERADSGTTTGADAALAVADAIRTTAGATGTVQATASTSARHAFAVAAFKAVAGGGGPDPIAGTVSSNLASLSAAALGALLIVGVAAPVLGGLTGTGSGQVQIRGAAAPSLGPMTAAGAGGLPIIASVAETLGPASASSSGAIAIAGTVASTLDPATASASGESQPVSAGALDQTLSPLTAFASGTLPVAGQSSASLAPVTAFSAGVLPIKATANFSLSPVTGTGTGSLAQVGSGSVSAQLAPLTGMGTGRLAISGAAAPALGSVASVATGTALIRASLAVQLAPIQGSATAASLAAGYLISTLDPMAASGIAALAIAGSTDRALDPLTASATGGEGNPVETPPERRAGSVEQDRSLSATAQTRMASAVAQIRLTGSLAQSRALSARPQSRRLPT